VTSRSEEKKIKTLFGFPDVRFFEKLFQNNLFWNYNINFQKILLK
jgi:hypothetical protein